MFCEHFIFEELTEKFLKEITEVHALDIHLQNKNPDKLYNWGLGKKLSAFTIVDCYSRECMEKEECIDIPDYCYDYLETVDIQDIKQFKAYFTWECAGSVYNYSDIFTRKYYLDGCKDLFEFCDLAPIKRKECGFFKILSKVDKRTNPIDRRNIEESVSDNNRIGEKDRRIRQDYRQMFL